MKFSLLSTRQRPKDKAAVWHILREDGKSVCGRDAEKGAATCGTTPLRVCKGCDLMKGADTVRLA